MKEGERERKNKKNQPGRKGENWHMKVSIKWENSQKREVQLGLKQ